MNILHLKIDIIIIIMPHVDNLMVDIHIIMFLPHVTNLSCDYIDLCKARIRELNWTMWSCVRLYVKVVIDCVSYCKVVSWMHEFSLAPR